MLFTDIYLFCTLLLHILNFPAIHRGHYPLPDRYPGWGTAHDRTNLLHRGHLPSSEVPQEWVFAHGELQELRSGEKDDKTAMSANTKKYDEAFCLRFKPVAHQLCYIRYLWHFWCATRTNSLRVEQGSRC
jgi:hypothetical protein